MATEADAAAIATGFAVEPVRSVERFPTGLAHYGDALLPVALTRTALLHHGEDTDYVEHWCEHLGLDAGRRALLSLYAALFCLDFMGEVGQRFNRSEPIAIDERAAERLSAILREQLRAA